MECLETIIGLIQAMHKDTTASLIRTTSDGIMSDLFGY
jgi:hypothetical protein